MIPRRRGQTIKKQGEIEDESEDDDEDDKAPENFRLKAALRLVLSESRLQPEAIPPLQRRVRMS